MVPTHIVLGRREERGVVFWINIMMDLTGLYPTAAEHSAMEAVGGKFNCSTEVRFWFSIYSQSLLKKYRTPLVRAGRDE